MMKINVLMKDNNQFELVMEDEKAKKLFTEFCDPDSVEPIVIDSGTGEGTVINRYWVLAASLVYEEDE